MTPSRLLAINEPLTEFPWQGTFMPFVKDHLIGAVAASCGLLLGRGGPTLTEQPEATTARRAS